MVIVLIFTLYQVPEGYPDYAATHSGAINDSGITNDSVLEKSFRRDILPIFNQYACFDCHGDDGGLTLSTVHSLLEGGNHGPAIVSGNASTSLLMEKLSPNPSFGSRMPKGESYLSDSLINIIRVWIDGGAKDN